MQDIITIIRNNKKKVCYDMSQDNILISRLSKLLGNDQCSNNSCNNTLRRLTLM